MKVKDIIKELEKHDPEEEVRIEDDQVDFEIEQLCRDRFGNLCFIKGEEK